MRRLSLAIAIVAAMAVAIPSAALAVDPTGAEQQVSQITGAFSPNVAPADSFVPGSLFVQPTNYNDNGQCVNRNPAAGFAIVDFDINNCSTDEKKVPDKGHESDAIAFDQNIKFTLKKLSSSSTTLQECQADPTQPFDPANPHAGLTGSTTAQAVEACGKKSVIGSGMARARYRGFCAGGAYNDPNCEARETVTAFLGPTSNPGQDPSSETTAPNTGMVGGNPTIILHAYGPDIQQTSVIQAELLNASDVPSSANLDTAMTAAGGASQFGKALYVPNDPDVAQCPPGCDPTANDLGAIVMFNTVVRKDYTYVANGQKKKASLTSAKCSGDDDWDFAAGYVFDDGSVDTDSMYQVCAEG